MISLTRIGSGGGKWPQTLHLFHSHVHFHQLSCSTHGSHIRQRNNMSSISFCALGLKPKPADWFLLHYNQCRRLAKVWVNWFILFLFGRRRRRESRGNLEWYWRKQSLSRNGLLFLGPVSVVVRVTISLWPPDCGILCGCGCKLIGIAVSVCRMF